MKRPWMKYEEDLVRELYGKIHPGELGRRLGGGSGGGRSRSAVHQKAVKLGLAFDRRAEFGPEFDAFFKKHYGLGWSDADIAAGWGCNRGTVGVYRRKKGLAHHAFNARHREKTRRALVALCKGSCVPSLGALRALTWQLAVVRKGWPEGLTRTQGEILDQLESGPKTRRMICAALGKPWRGCKSLTDTHGHSHMETLRKRGLVVRQGGRGWKGGGRGCSAVMYALAPGVKRQFGGGGRRAA